MEGNRGEAQFRPDKAEFTPERFARLLFLSFQFSQGDEDLQRDIFTYLKFKHPELSMDDSTRAQVDIMATAEAQKYLGRLIPRGFHIAKVKLAGSLLEEGELDDDIIRAEVLRRADTMQEILNSPLVDHDVVARLTRKLLEVDLDFVEEGRPRPGRKKIPLGSFSKFRSQFLDHGIRAEPTRDPEYDAMFREVRTCTREALIASVDETSDDATTDIALLAKSLVRLYNRKNKDTKVDPNWFKVES